MQMVYGDETQVLVSPTVALGGEDTLVAPFSPGSRGRTRRCRADGGAFLARGNARNREPRNVPGSVGGDASGDAAMVALVDESSFIRRFGAASPRLADRRATWRRVLASRIDVEPLFVSLEAEDLAQGAQPAGRSSR
jgi:hypothetical protein